MVVPFLLPRLHLRRVERQSEHFDAWVNTETWRYMKNSQTEYEVKRKNPFYVDQDGNVDNGRHHDDSRPCAKVSRKY